MSGLRRLLGLAPSEMSFELFVEKVEKERNRVRDAIAEWRRGISLKPVKQAREKKGMGKVKAKSIRDEYNEVQRLLALVRGEN